MQLHRRELSQLTAEIERIRSNRPLSRKTKRNRRWMEKESGKNDRNYRTRTDESKTLTTTGDHYGKPRLRPTSKTTGYKASNN